MTPKEMRALVVGDEIRNKINGRERKLLAKHDSNIEVLNEETRHVTFIMYCQAPRWEVIRHQS